MRRKRGAFDSFANPFVVLADVMVSLVCIIALFLLSTTVYSEETERYLELQRKREGLMKLLQAQLVSKGLSAAQTELAPGKYRLGETIELSNDASLQRIRFLKGALEFKRNSSQFVNPKQSEALVLSLGTSLLKNRSAIKSIVIEGQARPDERDPWELSQRRAEKMRRLWADKNLIGDVNWENKLEAVDFLRKNGLDDQSLQHWHREEYQARRVKANSGLGVIPQAWIITAGRGDQQRREGVVEFKVEYTLHAPLDEVLGDLPPDQKALANARGLIQKGGK